MNILATAFPMARFAGRVSLSRRPVAASAAKAVFFAVGLTMSGWLTTDAWSAVVLPTGLSPGSQYQLAFVTSITTTFASKDISVYNSFVTDLALQNPDLPSNVSWTAILGTQSRQEVVITYDPVTEQESGELVTYPGVSRQANNPTTTDVPIYNTLGQRVVASGPSLFTGPWENSMQGDEDGNLVQPVSNNSNLLDGVVGWTRTGDIWYMNNAYLGMSTSTSFGNDEITIRSQSETPPTLSYRIRALSSPITVVPEPSAFTLGFAGLASGCLFLCRRRFRALPW